MEVTDRPAGTTPPTLGPPAGRPMPPTGRLGRLTSSRRVLLVTVVLGTLVYAALLHYSVEVVFAPLFPYLEYRSPDALLYAATLALAVLSSVVLPRRMGKPSDTALWIIQVSAALPALLCAQYLTMLTEPEAFVFGVHVVGTMVLIRLVCAGMPPITFGHRLQNLGRLFWIALVVYAVAIYGLLVVFAGFGRHVLAMTISAGGLAPGGAAEDPASGPPSAPAAPPTAEPTAPPAPALLPGSGPRTPLVLALGAAAVLGFLAVPLADVLTAAAAALGGGS